MTKAEPNKFRVICKQTLYSEKHIVDDYPTLKRAEKAAKAINSKLQLCHIYNDKGILIDLI